RRADIGNAKAWSIQRVIAVFGCQDLVLRPVPLQPHESTARRDRDVEHDAGPRLLFAKLRVVLLHCDIRAQSLQVMLVALQALENRADHPGGLRVGSRSWSKGRGGQK